MLVYPKTYMSRGIPSENRHSSFCLNAFDLPGLKAFRSLEKIHRKGLQYAKMSSQTVITVNSSSMQDSHSSFTYEAAMEALSSLITRKKRDANKNTDTKYTKLERMFMYIQILGIKEQIADLNIIHVAGTKGKGSTCTFCEAILRQSGFKTGLFTSPHLIDVKERFRLNGLEISEDQFLLYFWGCWNQLKDKVTDDLPMPPLFQFLTLLGLKIFVSEKVDVAIIEVGIGGTYDSTNVIQDPTVCGITSLGFDHTEILGDTLGEIALHKAGIFKPKVPAFTVPQLPEALVVLKQRAHELEVPLEVAAPLTYRRLNGVKLSLSGDHQLVNAGLAVSLCKSWLNTTGNWEKLFKNDIGDDSLPEAFLKGLSTANLSGRAQIVHDVSLGLSNPIKVDESSYGQLIFYLDGAHSPESMEACANWFSNVVNEKIHRPVSFFSKNGNFQESCSSNSFIQKSNDQEKSTIISKRILLFNCMDVRDPEVILPRLVDICASSGSNFSKAIFVPSISTYGKVTSGNSDIPAYTPSKDLAWQFNLQRVWERIIHKKDIKVNKNSKTGPIQPPAEFLYDDISHCNHENGKFSCSAVFPSLPMAVSFLRNSVRDNPSLRLQRDENDESTRVNGGTSSSTAANKQAMKTLTSQVLVTGSLHLVGDVLKLLKR